VASKVAVRLIRARYALQPVLAAEGQDSDQVKKPIKKQDLIESPTLIHGAKIRRTELLVDKNSVTP
jgi:hypothetical protein